MKRVSARNISVFFSHGFSLLYAVFLPLFLCGCIHQYPEDIQVKDVTLDVELLPDREFIPLPATTKSATDVVPEGYLPRIIIEARRTDENTPVIRSVMTVNTQEWALPRITLPLPLSLKSVPYHLTVWADYTRAESLPDTYYNTENLRSVSYILPYEEDYLRRDAFFGNASIDLTEQEEHSRIQIAVKRPLAHYRIVATDVQEFLNKQHANGRPGAGEYEVKVTYQYFLVTHLNAFTGEPVNSGSGFSYTREINLTDAITECELAADYVLADDRGSVVTVTVEVKEKGGEDVALSRVANLEIPYRRGHTTTVTGAFLTVKGGGSMPGGIDIGIDGDYDGEINIDANN